MTQDNKIILRLAIDISAALIGLVFGLAYLHLFQNGVTLPLESSDSLVLISSTFTALFLRSVFEIFMVGSND